METITYEDARKKVNLVERDSNEGSIVDKYRIFVHEEKDIISLAKQIESAEGSIKNNACGKLAVILEQIRMLQNQAKQILEKTDRDYRLHRAACNFKRVPGHIYHLYMKQSGQEYFSMLSPEEWGSSRKDEYIGSFRLEYDSSWTPTEDIEKVDNINFAAKKLMFKTQNHSIEAP